MSELESEERDIETFKRFNYYFEPPKNKPKINFNVKDIVVTKKPPSSETSSLYFGELTSSFNSNNTPYTDDEFQQELNAPKPQPISNLDNFLHGIIGEELKTGQD